uniref:HAT C-terminal dimerisation domain-containing protein n=1 Tax=Schizaphis graminum TaxID=13262 RepID=A0A2S2PC08_SCHGA
MLSSYFYVWNWDFVNEYQSDISSEFTSQFMSLKEMIMDKHLRTIGELAKFILENNYSISYSEVLGACMLFLVLPVTVATAERSFSKLKLIKNFLRNSIAQDRLTNIAILNVEQIRTSELNLEKVINDFANLKAKKMI